MKIRNGFVSNSSSSSFVIGKNWINGGHLQMILENPNTDWEIKEGSDYISGYSHMNNYSMREFLESIGVDMQRVHWGDEYDMKYDPSMDKVYQLIEVPDPWKDESGKVVFHTSGCEVMTFMANGDIYVKGELVENNQEVVDGFKEWLKDTGYLKE